MKEIKLHADFPRIVITKKFDKAVKQERIEITQFWNLKQECIWIPVESIDALVINLLKLKNGRNDK